ncbi:apoptosis facilitator Bcl-2-like protein 14 [Hyperolius riggenbachi]|uniref:apoptosis facilitator Bcl-2-like protein 14 n=1 Tax=Hyperolius riggenbachi TaxID=752182 RepID=UPI0035A268F3
MVSVPENTMDEIPLKEEENSMEYRLLMAYAQRALPKSKFASVQDHMRPRESHKAVSKGTENKAVTNGEVHKKKAKRKNWRKRLTPKCLRSPENESMMASASLRNGEKPVEERARTIASTLHDIVQRIKRAETEDGGFRGFTRMHSVQPDGGSDEDEIIANIVQILRSTGDKLNDQINQEKSLVEKIQDLWSYTFFKKVADSYLSDAIPTSEPEEEEQQTDRIALCVHATAALSTLDNQPMNRVLGFGARYLQENYSPWVQSKGGWENIMCIQGEDEVE